MPLQQQPILLPRVDLEPGFQLTVPSTHRLRPVQPLHHRFQHTAATGPAYPAPPPGWSAPWPAGPWAGQIQQVQTGEDDITGSWFKIAWLRNLSNYQEPSHITAPTRRSHPNPAKPDARAIAQIAAAPSARSLQKSHTHCRRRNGGHLP